MISGVSCNKTTLTRCSLIYSNDNITDGENMRRKITKSPILVQFNILRIIDGEEFEGIDGHQDRTNVGVKMTSIEPFLKTKFTRSAC